VAPITTGFVGRVSYNQSGLFVGGISPGARQNTGRKEKEYFKLIDTEYLIKVRRKIENEEET
jgi:hypothetical protein